MKIVEQSVEWVQAPPKNALQIIELAGRTCYLSSDKITENSAVDFVRRIMKSGHASVIEHVSASVRFITSRSVTHEMVRHRMASYSQESQRYCAYNKDKFGNELTVIRPVWYDKNPIATSKWIYAMEDAEHAYFDLLNDGWTAQEAREVLPNSVKTEIVMTANMREWRHFFTLRCSQAAHPQIRDLSIKALNMFKEAVPVIFEDINL